MTQIPLVQRCEVNDCGFNEANMGHAAAIQVGDVVATAVSGSKVTLQDPRCDTYPRRPGALLGAADLQAWVGGCKAETGSSNQSFRCTADAIVVNRQ